MPAQSDDQARGGVAEDAQAVGGGALVVAGREQANDLGGEDGQHDGGAEPGGPGRAGARGAVAWSGHDQE